MITLVLGGARSGKSEVGERLAARSGDPVTCVATGAPTDPEMAARIEEHRARRPPEWRTVEPAPSALAESLREARGTVLLDSLGTWVASFPELSTASADLDAPHDALHDALQEALLEALRAREGATIVVSEEVGLGVHPPTEVGRRFRDVLGRLNSAVASLADDVLLVVAGRVLPLDPLDAGSHAGADSPTDDA